MAFAFLNFDENTGVAGMATAIVRLVRTQTVVLIPDNHLLPHQHETPELQRILLPEGRKGRGRSGACGRDRSVPLFCHQHCGMAGEPGGSVDRRQPRRSRAMPSLADVSEGKTAAASSPAGFPVRDSAHRTP